MKLEDVCEDIEKVLKDIYGMLKETDKPSADDILKLATGLIHDQNIFFGNQFQGKQNMILFSASFAVV